MHVAPSPIDRSMDNHTGVRRRPLTVAVTSGKGGAGKTSISANLAAALATEGRRVLLVDADLGLANLDIILGVEPKVTIADVLNGKATIDEVLLPTKNGLTLLPATSGFHQLTNLDDGQKASLFAALESIEPRFDVVLLDCAAGIGSDVQLFGAVADEVLVVATADPTSLADAYALMKVLHTESQRRSYRLVASQVSSDRQARSVFGVLSKVTDQYLDLEIDFIGHIPTDDAWRRAVLERRLAFETNPSSPASLQTSKLAERILRLERKSHIERRGIGDLLVGARG